MLIATSSVSNRRKCLKLVWVRASRRIRTNSSIINNSQSPLKRNRQVLQVDSSCGSARREHQTARDIHQHRIQHTAYTAEERKCVCVVCLWSVSLRERAGAVRGSVMFSVLLCLWQTICVLFAVLLLLLLARRCARARAHTNRPLNL